MREKRGRALCGAAALLAGALLSCAVRHEPSPAASESANGTVLVVRADRFDGDGVLSERAQLVRDIGGSASGATVPLVEVVVRRDDGHTVALMASPDDALAAGERVLVAGGAVVRAFASAGR